MDRRERLTKVDSELAITALLATTVLAFETHFAGLYPFVQVIGLSLLATTLLRRICIVEGLKQTSWLMRSTNYLIRPATTITFLYIIYLIQNSLIEFVPSMDGVIGYSALAVLITLMLALGWQFGIGTFLSHGGIVVQEVGQENRGTLLGVVFQRFGRYLRSIGDSDFNQQVQKSPQPERGKKSKEELIEDGDFDELWRRAKRGWLILFKFIAVVIAAFLIYVLMVWIVQSLVGGSYWNHVVILLAIIFVTGYFQNWYSRYGLVQFDETPMIISILSRSGVYLFIAVVIIGSS